jgi:hypothetical protein
LLYEGENQGICDRVGGFGVKVPNQVVCVGVFCKAELRHTIVSAQVSDDEVVSVGDEAIKSKIIEIRFFYVGWSLKVVEHEFVLFWRSVSRVTNNVEEDFVGGKYLAPLIGYELGCGVIRSCDTTGEVVASDQIFGVN